MFSNFSWVLQPSQEKLRTMVIQICWWINKVYRPAIPHSWKQRHQVEARVDKTRWFVWNCPPKPRPRSFFCVCSQEQNAGKVYYEQCENGECKRILEDVIMMKKKCKNIELFTFYYYILFHIYLVAAALIVWITNHQEIYQFLPLM